ncbi:hypothetical protein ScPMuIL_001951 [Solemya velum]
MDITWITEMPLWLRISGSLLTIIFISLYVYSSRKHRLFKDMGIPGPKPVFLLGNLMWWVKKGLVQTDMELTKAYGKVYGTFNGVLPSLIISDPELIKEICIKNFHDFPNRFNLISSVLFGSALTMATDDHWKFLRTTLSPTFSSGKLKQMVPVVHKCVDSLVKNITKQTSSDKAPDFKPIFGAYTMDIIASTAFGIEVDSQSNPDDQFVKNAREAMDFSMTNPMLILALIFPQLNGLFTLLKYEFFPKHNVLFFVKVTKAALAERKEDNTGYNDFLQLMVNAHKDTDAEIDEDIGFNFEGYKARGLTEDEMIANALLFFLAAYDTTSSALTFAAFALATNPDCQEKLIDEIDKEIGKNKPTYLSAMGLSYLDMFFSEVLRLYPPANRFNRTAERTVVINGCTIPKGIDITVPVFALHRNEEFWPNPEKFDPERFTPEEKAKRNPYTYLPFGLGPRICLGMRLAQLEAKLAIIAILQRFRFRTTPETEITPTFANGGITKPANGMFLQVEPRGD